MPRPARLAGDAGPTAVPLWPLPLVAGLLPAVATLLAMAVGMAEGRPACNPFIDDCGSISRLARHGLANHLFRTLVLPAGLLQLLMWLTLARSLADAGLAARDAIALAVLGAGAGFALVVYGSFLGTEGEVYRWLRRWGTMVFFGGTLLAMLVLARSLERLHAAGRLVLPRPHQRAMLGLLGFVAGIGVMHGLASVSGAAALEKRMENLTEWWGALALTVNIVVIADLCRRWKLAATLSLAGRTAGSPD